MLTIIIPSIDRKEYLRRSIDYYSKSSYKTITVTNTPIYDNKVKQIISNKPFIDRLQEAFEFVNTEYCVLSPDDDFISLDYLKRSIEYLDSNPDVSSVVGNYITFNKVNFSYNTFIHKMPCHLETESIFRIQNGIKNYSNNFWVVYRTTVLKKIINITKSISNHNLVEILFKVIALSEGKIARINTVYNLREYYHISWGTSEISALEFLLNDANLEEIKEIRMRLHQEIPNVKTDILNLIIINYTIFLKRRALLFSTVRNKFYKFYCKLFFFGLLSKKEKFFLKSVKESYSNFFGTNL